MALIVIIREYDIHFTMDVFFISNRTGTITVLPSERFEIPRLLNQFEMRASGNHQKTGKRDGESPENAPGYISPGLSPTIMRFSDRYRRNIRPCVNIIHIRPPSRLNGKDVLDAMPSGFWV
jgi:hypothetical protein